MNGCWSSRLGYVGVGFEGNCDCRYGILYVPMLGVYRCKKINQSYIIICAVLQIGRSLVRSQLVSLEFFIDIKSFRSHYGPRVDSASNRNEYQENFLGVKAAGA